MASLVGNRLLAQMAILIVAYLATADQANAIMGNSDTGLERLTALTGDPLAQPLLNATSAHVTSDGTRLIVGRSSELAQLSIFTLDDAGLPSFEQEFSVTNPELTGLTRVNALAGSADGQRLYAAGQGGLAVIGINQASGALALLDRISVVGSIDSIALSPQQNLLVVGVSNVSIGAQLRTYTLDAEGRAPTLQDTWTYSEATAASEVAINSAGTRAYVANNSTLAEHSLSASGQISEPLLHPLDITTDLDIDFVLSVDERRIYLVVADGGVNYYSRESVGELFSNAQHIPTRNPQVREGSSFSPNGIATNSAGTVLYVARQSFFVSSISRISFSCLDSYTVNEPTGLFRFSGFICSGIPGSLVVLHPQLDRIYSINSSVTQLLGNVTSGSLSVFQSAPTLAETSLVSAVLPSARSEGNRFSRAADVSAFATVINTGAVDAQICSLRTTGSSSDVGSVSYQLVDPATNLPLVGSTANDEFNIPQGGSTSLVFSVDNRLGEVESVLLEIQAVCLNASAAPTVPGVNTLLFSAANGPLADLISSTATLTQPGIVTLPSNSGLSLFTAAAVNIGDSDTIEVRPELELSALVDGLESLANLPDVLLEICQTDPITSECLADRAPSTTLTMNTNELATFAVFITGNGLPVDFRPETNRVFIVFVDQNQNVRGGSSVALETAP